MEDKDGKIILHFIIVSDWCTRPWDISSTFPSAHCLKSTKSSKIVGSNKQTLLPYTSRNVVG